MRAAVGLVLALSIASLGSSACATYHDDLERGEKAFDASEHERALAIFRLLEPDLDRLTETERAHYAYLRGMTDFRIGYKAEARHWLAFAAAIAQQSPGALPPEWTKRMSESLKELNEEIYTAGIESLSNATASAAEGKAKGDDDTTGADTSSDQDAPKKKPAKPVKSDDE